MNIGERIKQRRTELNMTQTALADKLSVSRSAVSNWETEKNYPDLQIIVMLSEVLDVSLDDLLKGDANVVEKIAKDTKESGKLRKRTKALIVIVAALILVLGGLTVSYLTIWHPTYMSYEESGLYTKDNILMTDENYYSFQSYDSSDNKGTFIYMTTTAYESHKTEKSKAEARKVMNLNEYGRAIVQDGKGNVTVSDTITAVYYVPKDEVKKLNQKGGYWSESEDENKEKVEHLISVSQLVWKAQ